MQSKPKIDERPEQSYLGKRAVMPMSDFKTQLPAMIDEVLDWLNASSLQAVEAPFVRYHVINMPDRMDIEVGVPVDKAAGGNGRIALGTLPAGRYATLKYTGVENGIPANKTLIEWIADRGEQMAYHRSSDGDAFESRYETQLTDPEAEPNQEKWETEVAIKLRD